MTLSSLFPLSRAGRTGLARFALVCALLLPCGLQAAEERQHELEEKTSTELQKLTPLTDAKNWDGALALINGLKAKVGADSYDMAILCDIEAKVYLQKGDYAKAIPPWETALRLTDAHKYLSESAVEDLIYYLAQIYMQEANASKVPATQKQMFSKTISYLERWMAATKKPERDSARQEAQVLYANVLYNTAVLDPNNIDKELLKRAEEACQRGLHMAPKPKEAFYIILLAIAQQREDMPRLAELLELVVKQQPSKKDFWAQLGGVYLNLAGIAGNENDETKAREYNTRAILAIERAQALGFMKTPKENHTLMGIYFNVGQFGRATEILHTGLRDGSIENDIKNWELLGYSYLQVDKPYQAIEAYKEGAKRFPKSGQLDYQIATTYYSLNKPEDAFKHLQAALAKGGLEKPGTVYGFMAYVSWELTKYDEALAAVQKALSFPETQKDTQLPKMKTAIEEAIREREAAAGAKTAGL